jgi:hypothetical protein
MTLGLTGMWPGILLALFVVVLVGIAAALPVNHADVDDDQWDNGTTTGETR